MFLLYCCYVSCKPGYVYDILKKNIRGFMIMQATFVKIEDVNKFVKFVSKLKGKVYLKCGEIKVNAKSIIGAMYIVQEHPNNIVVEVEDPKEKALVLDFLMQGCHLKKD